MTDKQMVLDAIRSLPENASLQEMVEEIRVIAAIRRGRDDFACGAHGSHAEVGQALEKWAKEWGDR